MNNYPEYVKINEKKYKINTDFRIAIKCNDIISDENIGDNERGLAIIYLLFGDEGLDDKENHNKLLELALRYLTMNQDVDYNNVNKDTKIDMDFIQDMDYIEASFMSDYHIDLSNRKMHFWKFMNLLNGLSASEFGNCCVLNRVRNLRNLDLSKIKDDKERKELAKAKKQVELKKKEKQLTEKELNSMDKFNKLAGI